MKDTWQIHPLSDQERADLANRPTEAGVYQVLLGNDKDGTPAERKLAEQLVAANANIKAMARENRAFLRRAVGYVAGEGVRQFLDIGSGLPTSDNVHQVAQRVDSAVTTVYVDRNPRVAVHGRALLATDDRTHFLDHDLRHSGELLHILQTGQLIDFTRPVALVLVAILHFIQNEEEPEEIVQTLMAALPSGSFLVLSHAVDVAELRPAAAAYQAAGVPSKPALRSAEQIERFFAGLEPVEPGLVTVTDWRPDIPELGALVGPLPVLAGVYRKP
ncbi:SAM-dependent methyltransferase [Sphaerisporangium sp. NPDC005288]|uniref:SAM-dependent methyltransferase n=1 Tax=Sphaerisporangium sp. NPDC005288 TaxID=3155114 RepID=UPI0033A753F7